MQLPLIKGVRGIFCTEAKGFFAPSRKGLLSIPLCASAPLRDKNTYSSATPNEKKKVSLAKQERRKGFAFGR
jgi:hypothetical protein